MPDRGAGLRLGTWDLVSSFVLASWPVVQTVKGNRSRRCSKGDAGCPGH